jgi:hypothetical protein
VVVEIVDAKNALAAAKQRARNMEADETGGAGEEKGHGRAP